MTRECIDLIAAAGEAKLSFAEKNAGRYLCRAAIAGFLRISGDSFTLAALNQCLCACGVACSVEETGEVNRVKVWFPGVMGIPDGFAEMKIIIEDILPCQLGITYWFRYCTWQETQDYGLTWADLNAMTWHEWETYHEDPA